MKKIKPINLIKPILGHVFISPFKIGDKVNAMGLKAVILAVRFAKNSINYDVIIDGTPVYNVDGKKITK